MRQLHWCGLCHKGAADVGRRRTPGRPVPDSCPRRPARPARAGRRLALQQQRGTGASTAPVPRWS